MKTHLTEKDILEMASRIDVYNPNVDKAQEIAEMLDLEFDEKEGAYFNPDCTFCGKVVKNTMHKKSHPILCSTCYTGNA